jgi:hypothetical protein
VISTLVAALQDSASLMAASYVCQVFTSMVSLALSAKILWRDAMNVQTRRLAQNARTRF